MLIQRVGLTASVASMSNPAAPPTPSPSPTSPPLAAAPWYSVLNPGRTKAEDSQLLLLLNDWGETLKSFSHAEEDPIDLRRVSTVPWGFIATRVAHLIHSAGTLLNVAYSFQLFILFFFWFSVQLCKMKSVSIYTHVGFWRCITAQCSLSTLYSRRKISLPLSLSPFAQASRSSAWSFYTVHTIFLGASGCNLSVFYNLYLIIINVWIIYCVFNDFEL